LKVKNDTLLWQLEHTATFEKKVGTMKARQQSARPHCIGTLGGGCFTATNTRAHAFVLVFSEFHWLLWLSIWWKCRWR
jgi:hypothetical protein